MYDMISDLRSCPLLTTHANTGPNNVLGRIGLVVLYILIMDGFIVWGLVRQGISRCR